MDSKRELNSETNIRDFIYLLMSSDIWKTLQDKTQVFNRRKTEQVKSRGSHCFDVGEISQRLVEQMGGEILVALKAYLIGLLHDVGHIPFGHAGESVANDIIKSHEFSEVELKIIIEARKAVYGEKYVAGIKEKDNICFEHNENSALQYILMCEEFGFVPDQEVIVGILSHSTSRVHDLPPTLAEQAVRLADKLAYINYDVDDLYQSFPVEQFPEEHNALDQLYSKPLLDPDGNQFKIPTPDGRELSALEFVQLPVKDRIEILVGASVKDAKTNSMKGYETVLTGCNDITVALSDYQKDRKEAASANDMEAVARIDNLIKEKKKELFRRSPIMYAAYEIKERSDNFIRAGVGLSKESQVSRTTNAQSAVGNYDLLNEFIYKSLVDNLGREINENKNLLPEELQAKYATNPEFLTFYNEYLQYRDNEHNSMKGVESNTNGMTFPEIYTIVNFIGTHSNSQMYALAYKYGLFEKYTMEVLPKLQELQTDERFYDSGKGVLTKEGSKKREALISEYGAITKLDFSLEEEGVTPTCSPETVKLMEECGFKFVETEKSSTITLNSGEEVMMISSKFKNAPISEKQSVSNLDKFHAVMDEEERKQLSEIMQNIGFEMSDSNEKGQTL